MFDLNPRIHPLQKFRQAYDAGFAPVPCADYRDYRIDARICFVEQLISFKEAEHD